MDPPSLQSAAYNEDKSCINWTCFGESKPPANLQIHETRQLMKETEDILASEFSKLSAQKRMEAMYDIHCVGADLEETPEKIEELLSAFDNALQEKQGSSFSESSHHKAYADDRSFRLKFLRANMHNVDKAVSQMIHFLQNKARYFGDKAVGREITFDDLNEEDREMLLSGIYHIQKDKDQNGRVILYFFSEFIGKSRAETVCRVAYYVYFNILISIPEVQTKGLVFIFYDVTKIDELPTMPGVNLTYAIMDMIKSLPIRFSAMHFCLKTRQEKLELFNALLQSVFKLSPHYAMVRTRLHYGTDMELHYQLRTHGINTDSCPINKEGVLREDIKNAWFYKHQQMEQNSMDPEFVESKASFPLTAQDCQMVEFDVTQQQLDSFGGIGNRHVETKGSASSTVAAASQEKNSSGHVATKGGIRPTKDDILLGRGRITQYHPGNVRFRKFLIGYKDDYDTAPRRKRKEIVLQVTQGLGSTGVRFLKQMEVDGLWVESTEKETEKKIMQLFREFRKRKK